MWAWLNVAFALYRMPDSLDSGQWRSSRRALPGRSMSASRGIAFRQRSGAFTNRRLLVINCCRQPSLVLHSYMQGSVSLHAGTRHGQDVQGFCMLACAGTHNQLLSTGHRSTLLHPHCVNTFGAV